MRVYVFGNQDVRKDDVAIKAAEKLKGKIKGIEFVIVKPNEDLPFVDEDNVVIMDTVQGIKKVTLIDERKLDKLRVDKSVSVHDWDLGFQLKYLKKLGKIGKITIIGLPMGEKVEIEKIKKILCTLRI